MKIFLINLFIFLTTVILSSENIVENSYGRYENKYIDGYIEIRLSTKAIELELSDMEGLEDPSVMEYLRKKFERE